MNKERKQPQENLNLKYFDISEVSKLIEKYNRQFSIGTLAAEMIMERMEDKMGKQPPSREKLSLEEIQEQTKTILENTGIGLEPIKGSGYIQSEGDGTHSSVMRINLIDGKKFIDYLNVLDDKTITASQIVGLKNVAESLEKQLVGEYQLDNPDDERNIELFGNLSNIIELYKSIDFDNTKGLAFSIKNLEQYLEIARKGYLKEYLIAKKERLLDEVGGQNFGPSKWHTDSDEESYRRFWENAITALEKIHHNPKADELYKKIIENLKQSLTYAKSDLAASLLNRKNINIFEYKNIIDENYKKLQELN